MFTDDNPDKGTKVTNLSLTLKLAGAFTDDNPDKGTETRFETLLLQRISIRFTDDNPDKGTETHKGYHPEYKNPLLVYR